MAWHIAVPLQGILYNDILQVISNVSKCFVKISSLLCQWISISNEFLMWLALKASNSKNSKASNSKLKLTTKEDIVDLKKTMTCCLLKLFWERLVKETLRDCKGVTSRGTLDDPVHIRKLTNKLGFEKIGFTQTNVSQRGWSRKWWINEWMEGP